MRILVLALMISFVTAQSDQVFVKDGTTLTGKIIRVDQSGVDLEIAGEGIYRLPWNDLIAPAATTAGPVPVILGNGDRITAKVLGASGHDLKLESGLFGSLSVPLKDLPPPPLLPPPSRIVLDETNHEIEAAVRVFNATPWTGRIGLSGMLRTGNVDASLFRLDGGLQKLWHRDRFSASADVAYGETDGVTTASSAKGGAKFDHFYSQKFYSYALAEAGYDEVQNLDIRALAGIGMGYEFWKKSPDENLGVEAGINALYEAFDGGDSHFAPAARGALFYRDVFFSALKFEEIAELLLPLDDLGRWIFRSTSSVGMPLADGWSLRNVLEIHYQGDPPQDTEALDIKLLVGIEYAF